MNESEIVVHLSRAMFLTMQLSLPPIVVAALVGTLISLLQALTQIQEQTLSFVFKLIAVGVTLLVMAYWMGGEIYNYTVMLFDFFPNYAR